MLNHEQRVLLVQIREQHPGASAELIVSTLEHDGRLTAGTVSPNTVRRLFRLNGLDKKSARAAERGSIRRRWQAARSTSAALPGRPPSASSPGATWW